MGTIEMAPRGSTVRQRLELRFEVSEAMRTWMLVDLLKNTERYVREDAQWVAAGTRVDIGLLARNCGIAFHHPEWSDDLNHDVYDVAYRVVLEVL